MLEDIVIRLEDDFSEYLTDIRENEDKRIENELARIENERIRNEYFAKLMEETRSYWKRIKKVYGTVSENEDRFVLPDEYTELCMLDVFVNGFCLNKNEYGVEGREVVLRKPLDMIGTVVELVVTRNAVIRAEDYEDLRGLRGFSAYELAVQSGFKGTLEEWMWSLRGSGGYERLVTYYKTTSENERRIKLPYIYRENHLLDVFVNGFKLNEDEYWVEEVNAEYFLVLMRALDVVGTMVEMDVIDAYPSSFVEEDPTVPEHVKGILQEDIISWNGKSEFSGDYEDLDNKPDLSDFITNETNDLRNYYKKSESYTKEEIVRDFVGKELGKVLSSNDFTDEEKEKLEGLERYDDGEVKEDILANTAGIVKNAEDILDLGTNMRKENLKFEDLIDSEFEEKEVTGESITVKDSTNYKAKLGIGGNSYQETTNIENGDEYNSPSPEHPSEIKTVKNSVDITVCNKNLFDGEMEVGELINGLPSSNNSAIRSSHFIKIEKNTDYKIKLHLKQNVSTWLTVWFFDKDYQFIERTPSQNTSVRTFNSGNATFMKWDCLGSMSNTIGVQVEKGDTYTEYTEHKGTNHLLSLGDTELCKVEEYGDYIWKDKKINKWYKHKAINKVIFNGSETWVLEGSTEELGIYQFRVVLPSGVENNAKNITKQKLVESNYFLGAKYANTWNIDGTIVVRGDNALRIHTTAFTNVDDLKIWLNEHPLIAYYVLENEKEEEITDEVLIEQLESLDKVQTFYGTTHVYSINEIKPNLSLGYKVSNRLKRVDIDLSDYVSKQEVNGLVGECMNGYLGEIEAIVDDINGSVVPILDEINGVEV